MAYNDAIPQPGDLISTSQGQILGDFQAIDSGTTGTGIGFSRNHITMTDATNGGLHNRVDYYQAVSSPTITGFIGSLYPKTVTNVELFYKNGTKDMQISNSLLTASSGQAMIPGGLQVRCGSGNTGAGSTASISFTPNFLTAVVSVTTCGTGTDTNQSCLPSSASPSGFTLTASKNNFGYYWVAYGY